MLDEPNGANAEDVDQSELMYAITIFLENIQKDISSSLVIDEKVRAMTENAMKQPDHIITGQLTNAVNQFLLTMPVASMYGVNLIMNVIEHHSSITGNPYITQLCSKVREKINSQNYN